MNKVIVSGVVLALGTAALVGCGDENTTEVTVTTGMQVVEAGESIPECDRENQGQMAYVVDSARAYYCADEKWNELEAEAESAKNGADGEDGEDGSSCTVEAIEDGFDIVCDGKKVGSVSNGTDGTPGDSGSSCRLKDNGDGTIDVTCVEGESVVSATLYRAMCGAATYDPTTGFCYGDSVYSCGGAPYNPETHYCDNDQVKAVMCGEFLYNPMKYFCDNRDSTIYRYVTIGDQVWMAENLDYAYVEPTKDLESSSFCYDDDSANCVTYGRLYLWSAAMDSVGKFSKPANGCGAGATCSSSGVVRGVCPEGWHLPDSTEWEVLFEAVGGKDVAADILGSDTDDWASEIYGAQVDKATDSFGFSALPAGYRGNQTYITKATNWYFWTSKEQDGDNAYYETNHVGDKNVLTQSGAKGDGRSVRCVRD